MKKTILTRPELEELFPENLDLLPETDPTWPAKIKNLIRFSLESWNDHGANLSGITKTSYQLFNISSEARMSCMNQLPLFSELQRRHEKVIEYQLAHNPTAAHQAFVEHQEKLISGIVDDTANQHEGWTYEDFVEDFAECQRAADKMLGRIYEKFIPYARQVAQKFAEFAKMEADKLEVLDKERYDRFGVPYPGPSQLVIAFHNCAKMALHRVQPDKHSGSPRTTMPYLPI